MSLSDSERNSSILREMQRTSLDLIRIYNPTDEDFTIVWDGYKHIVPNKNKDTGYGKGMRVVQRYLAMWYLKHITDKIITEKQDAKIAQLRTKYEDAGIEDSILKAQLEVERNRSLRTDNEQEVKKIAEVVWLGIEERYGMDDEVVEQATSIDQRPVHEKVVDELTNKVYKKKVEPVEEVEEKKYPINKSKNKLEQEVSA